MVVKPNLLWTPHKPNPTGLSLKTNHDKSDVSIAIEKTINNAVFKRLYLFFNFSVKSFFNQSKC